MIVDTRHELMIGSFTDVFHADPEIIITAPGRINLIGEHTDYSDGFVLPVAINLDISIAMKPREDLSVQIFSLDFNEKKSIDLSNLEETDEGWIEYIKGIIWVLQNEGYVLKGWDGVLSGTIPVGAGLSSSAALEIAALKAFGVSSNLSISPTDMAIFGRKAEVDWVGVNVGIMDQLISANGKAGHALLLDCQSLEFEYIPIPQDIRFVVMDTMTQRKLSNSSYNKRHDEVKSAADFLGVPTLREVKMDKLEEVSAAMDPVLFKRARHVLSENERVIAFCDAMQAGDYHKMGDLINASHASLRDDFDVSSKALNTMVEIAQSQPGCLGARMTGAGFGGCALALVQSDEAEDFIDAVKNAYTLQMDLEPSVYTVESRDGVNSRRLNQ